MCVCMEVCACAPLAVRVCHASVTYQEIMVPVFNGLVTGRTVLCLRLVLFDNRISSLSNFMFHTQRCLSVEGVYYGHKKLSF